MAMLMISGGKIGSMIGRRRAFAIGCVIYGIGSLTTALAPNLPVLILGWSVLEGIGAALILPAIVALVAGELRGRGPTESLRPGDGRGRDRRRGRAADRWHRHDLLLLAVGVRRRSAGRGGGCRSEVWLGTMSTITLMPGARAAATRSSKSARVPSSGATSR
jgi:hypothetical protein